MRTGFPETDIYALKDVCVCVCVCVCARARARAWGTTCQAKGRECTDLLKDLKQEGND